jgi:hypothetical protein
VRRTLLFCFLKVQYLYFQDISACVTVTMAAFPSGILHAGGFTPLDEGLWLPPPPSAPAQVTSGHSIVGARQGGRARAGQPMQAGQVSPCMLLARRAPPSPHACMQRAAAIPHAGDSAWQTAQVSQA